MSTSNPYAYLDKIEKKFGKPRLTRADRITVIGYYVIAFVIRPLGIIFCLNMMGHQTEYTFVNYLVATLLGWLVN